MSLFCMAESSMNSLPLGVEQVYKCSFISIGNVQCLCLYVRSLASGPMRKLIKILLATKWER